MKPHCRALVVGLCFASSLQAAPPDPCLEETGTVVNKSGTFISATATTNHYLKPGQCLVSANRKYMAVMQASDGNLVTYQFKEDGSKQALWSTRTGGNPDAGVLVQQDGHFVVYRRNGIADGAQPQGNPASAVWVSNPAKSPFADYILHMQDDGNLVLYPGTHPFNVGKYLFSSKDQSQQSRPPKRCTQWQCWNDSTVGMQCAYIPVNC